MQTEGKVEVRRRFTVHEYHRMAEAGIFDEGDRVELIDGEVVEMNPIGSRHANCVRELGWLLNRQIGDDLRVDVQNPIRLDETHEPQPDLAIIRVRDYRNSLPTAGDTLLVIEVSDTTLAYDRNVKLPLYAGFGILETWIFDLESNVVERHNEPADGIYRTTKRAAKGESISSAAIPELSIPVDRVIA